MRLPRNWKKGQEEGEGEGGRENIYYWNLNLKISIMD